MGVHLEDLIAEHLEWQGYIVQRNVLVGKRLKGGWVMELDLVGYHPQQNKVRHIEPSLDAHSWAVREVRFKKKFVAGRKYVFTAVFPWVSKSDVEFEQLAIVPSRGKRARLAGADLKTVDEYVAEIRADIEKLGIASRGAVPSKYPLLRLIQFVLNGYNRVVKY